MKFLKSNIKSIMMILLLIISFLVLDIGLRYITYNNYEFYSYLNFPPTGFTISWIIVLICIIILSPKKIRKIIYITTILISNLITYSQYLHFKNIGRFYNVNDIFLLKEGSDYFDYAIAKTDIKILLILAISLLSGILVTILINKIENHKKEKIDKIFLIGMTIILCIGLRICAYLNYGEPSDGFDASTNGKTVYEEFIDPTKNLQVTGLYENFYRGIYIYIKNKIIDDTEERTKEVEKYLKENKKEKEQNEYTGILENKNIIYILMESIDNFLITEEIMPTVYKLKNEGLNFTNKYTPFFGNGQTINTEFSTNTGLYSPNNSNVYNLNNTYKTSLANMFKENDYIADSLHFNNGIYYNRLNFHTNLGYNNHYALNDMNIDNEKYDYQYDSNLILSPKVYDLIVKDEKFLTYITTYSTHLPFNSNNERCKTKKYDLVASDAELTCIKNLARDTDEMIRLLIENLKKDGILDNTAIVLVSDHYLYGYSNVQIAKNETNEYLLQRTPFIIWSNNIEHKNIDILVDSADILPTILNMFNIEYDPNLYVGEDAFSKNRKNYIYFNEDTYYDGLTLYDINNISESTETYKEIKELIKFNENIININYLK